MRAIRPTPITKPNRRLASAEALMMRFAARTGLTSKRPLHRYLWTDAFAVCNFLGLAKVTGRADYVDLALDLIDAVHAVLGHHREDDPRRGWLSGLSEREGADHPTLGGLRIGKKLPERRESERFDHQLEWSRDGQYYHYLTKWMHALDQVARYTGVARFNRWARELAKTAHDAFLQPPGHGGRGHLFWKMSIDLSRPLVPQMSPHDPLDGLVTAVQLQRTAYLLSKTPDGPDLTREIPSLAGTVELRALATTDPLSLGGLLIDASRIAQLNREMKHPQGSLLRAVLAACLRGVRRLDATLKLHRPAGRRLAFRELGLAIGLEGLVSIDADDDDELQALLKQLRRHLWLAQAIESFWSVPSHRKEHVWLSHRDINDVMLATSLLADNFLELSSPPFE